MTSCCCAKSLLANGMFCQYVTHRISRYMTNFLLAVWGWLLFQNWHSYKDWRGTLVATSCTFMNKQITKSNLKFQQLKVAGQSTYINQSALRRCPLVQLMIRLTWQLLLQLQHASAQPVQAQAWGPEDNICNKNKHEDEISEMMLRALITSLLQSHHWFGGDQHGWVLVNLCYK